MAPSKLYCLSDVSQDMAKIGGYRYPDDLDPDEAEEFINVLVNEFGGVAENREAFAQAAGHKTKNSGAFTRKVADARKYGLMTPRGDYTATDLGFDLANPEDETARRKAKFEMLHNIELLGDTYQELNGKTPPNEFWRVLGEIADTNPKESREAADRVEFLYRSMLRAEVDEDPEGEDTDSTSPGSEESESNITDDTGDTSTSPTQTEGAIYVRVGDDEMRFGEVSDVNLKLSQHFLESKKSGPPDEEEGGEGVQMKF